MKTLFKMNKALAANMIVSLDEIKEMLIALPGMGVEDAREIIAARMVIEADEAMHAANATTPEEIRFVREAIAFPKAEKRITSSDADHTARLSDSSSDSDAMKAFLAKGGEINVLATRNSKGLVKSRTSVSGGAPRINKSRMAHNAHDRNLRALNAH